MLSIIVPVYNEYRTIKDIIRILEALPIDKEIVVVDDGSTDGTREILENQIEKSSKIKVVYHPRNFGKGQAIRTGIQVVRGQSLIVQDADLEYEPKDILGLLKAMNEHGARVVYGSRFLSGKKVTSFWHRSVNYSLTALTNVLCGSSLSDMETCYKLFDTQFIRSLHLESSGFDHEVEVTVKTLLCGEKIFEFPLSYYKGRSYKEGKKVCWKDGIKAIRAIFYYRFKDFRRRPKR